MVYLNNYDHMIIVAGLVISYGRTFCITFNTISITQVLCLYSYWKDASSRIYVRDMLFLVINNHNTKLYLNCFLRCNTPNTTGQLITKLLFS